MSFFQVYLSGMLAILVMMVFLWLVSLGLKNSSIVDIFWGAGFVLVGWVYFLLTPDGYFSRKLLLMGLVTVWGLRLSLYILWRNWKKPEDFRYQEFRRQAGPKYWWFSFFKVFLLQGILLALISTPVLGAQIAPKPAQLTWLDILAVLVWVVGFFFEAVGDLQLARFKANPANKGKVMDRGVWRYTRHPNYFGDATQWFAYYLIALSTGAWWAIFSSALMTFLLVRVSGVALLEKSLKEKRPEYRAYIERTSSFIPWLPK